MRCERTSRSSTAQQLVHREKQAFDLAPGETYLLEWRVQYMNGGRHGNTTSVAHTWLPAQRVVRPAMWFWCLGSTASRFFFWWYYYLVMIVTDWSATCKKKKKQLWRVGCILRLYQQHTKHVSSVLTVRRSWTIIYPLRYIWLVALVKERNKLRWKSRTDGPFIYWWWCRRPIIICVQNGKTYTYTHPLRCEITHTTSV